MFLLHKVFDNEDAGKAFEVGGELDLDAVKVVVAVAHKRIYHGDWYSGRKYCGIAACYHGVAALDRHVVWNFVKDGGVVVFAVPVELSVEIAVFEFRADTHLVVEQRNGE